jgi:hypothetical protein
MRPKGTTNLKVNQSRKPTYIIKTMPNLEMWCNLHCKHIFLMNVQVSLTLFGKTAILSFPTSTISHWYQVRGKRGMCMRNRSRFLI